MYAAGNAYRSLKPPARALLVELYDLYNGQNNGELFLSVRKAARSIRVGNNLATKAFRELEDKGFIRVSQKGSFNQKLPHATQWVLTEYPHAGKPPSKDFMRWQAPGMQALHQHSSFSGGNINVP